MSQENRCFVCRDLKTNYKIALEPDITAKGVITLNKGLLIAIIIVLLGAAGAGYWYFYLREGASPTTTEESSSDGGFVGSIADALKVGTAMKCTWSYQGDSATFYLKGNKYYGEITTQETGTFKYIYRDDCTYYWQEGQSQGTKLCVTLAEGEEYDTSDLEAADSSAQALGYEYSCNPEVVTDSRFTLPTGVEFLDLSQYMQQFKP